jgi:hypothetical protein
MIGDGLASEAYLLFVVSEEATPEIEGHLLLSGQLPLLIPIGAACSTAAIFICKITPSSLCCS